MVRKIVSALLACGAFAGFSQPAAAYAVSPLFSYAMMPQPDCAATLVPSTAALTAPVPAPSAKSAAILGGASALDRIRAEQASVGRGAALLVRADTDPVAASTGLAPGSGPAECLRFALPRATAPIATAPSAALYRPAGDDFLQTRRLAVSRTAFDRQWSRVSQDALSRGFVAGQAGLGHLAGKPVGLDSLAAVNAWTNRRIAYVEDARLYGAADYWAGAKATLRAGKGDCEDIAIAKLQLLAALGVPRSDLYLTIARDLARHADHAVLVVKLGGRYWMLDNATDQVLDADASYDYQPVLSFSEGRKWLHGAVLAAAY